MARYTAWKTVIDGDEKKHRSENATFKWLNEQAPDWLTGLRLGCSCRSSTPGTAGTRSTRT